MEYTKEEISSLLGSDCEKMYSRLHDYLMENYSFEPVWAKGGKYGKACVRYRRGGKTLCTLYLRERQLGVWIILGGNERAKFEENAALFSEEIREKYRTTETYHDGKWLFFDVEDDSLFDQLVLLLSIKKKPADKKT